MLLTLVRHGQCYVAENHLGYNACRNPHLTEQGRETACDVSLPVTVYDYAFVSPLHRAIETLRMSHVKYMKRIVTDDVRERRMNLCDLMDGEDINTKGETFEELDERIRRFISHITTLQDGSNTKMVVFTHFLFIRRLVEMITKEDPGKIEYGGSVTLDL